MKLKLKERVEEMFTEKAFEAGFMVDKLRVEKLDGSYDGLTVRKEGQKLAPIFNLDLCCEQIFTEEDLGAQIDRFLSEAVQRTQWFPRGIPEMSYQNLKDRLFLRISGKNRVQNIDLYPHLQMEDLVVTVHVTLKAKQEGEFSYAIRKEMLQEFGVTEEQLFTDALTSSRKLFPAKIFSIYEALYGEAAEVPPFVVSTDGISYGAAAILYPEVVEELGRRFGKSYFLIPASVHEFLVIPDDGSLDPQDGQEMIRSVNQTLMEEDILSNNLYKVDENGFHIV